MHKFLTGIIIGGFLAGGICYAAATNAHYAVTDNVDAQKCINEATARTRVSFPLTSDGDLDYTNPVCWPSGIDGE